MYDYAWVHLIFTIPVALALSVIVGPLLSRRDVYKICFLQVVAVLYTIPWDSYLIRTGVWTYPPEVILGPKLFHIPAEELFFFVVQTYITSLLQILITKPVLTATYLHNEADPSNPVVGRLLFYKRVGQAGLLLLSLFPVIYRNASVESTYMRLILVWAGPVMFMLWTFAYQLLVTLPWKNTWLPIALPTLYLWVVDTLALRRGTWSIELGTKLGIHVWPYLEIEEAVFFLVTNVLVVWGCTAYDNAAAILDVFPNHFPDVPGTPSPVLLLKALFLSTSKYDTARLIGLRNALVVLAKKSRSFYLASGVFAGRLRIDLILLYGFCRVADDAVDNAQTAEDAEAWTIHFSNFLDAVYSFPQDQQRIEKALTPFPPHARSILTLLPTDKLPREPLYSLLDGFRIDQKFMTQGEKPAPPIQTFADLEEYATCVAATIGELCLHLVFYHDPDHPINETTKQRCLVEGARMGRALQYVNIVRDVKTDAQTGRCYIPAEWLSGSKITNTLEGEKEIEQLRKNLLDTAFTIYVDNRDAIEELPSYARGGIRVAVESYMEIGRVMRHLMVQGKTAQFAGGGVAGRATVSKKQRLITGWKAMRGWRGEA